MASPHPLSPQGWGDQPACCQSVHLAQLQDLFGPDLGEASDAPPVPVHPPHPELFLRQSRLFWDGEFWSDDLVCVCVWAGCVVFETLLGGMWGMVKAPNGPKPAPECPGTPCLGAVLLLSR